MASELIIYDRFEEPYALDCFAPGRFNVWHHGANVGHLYCLHVGNNVELADVEVAESCLYPGSRFLKLLRLKPKTINYQEKGIGTALLKFAFEYFRNLGCDCMHGKIVKIDLAARPWLPGWYKKHGFNVPDSGIGMIWKAL